MLCNVSVLILTKNEEADLPGCLESVAWCNDVWVLDSESHDKTADVARAYGAHVHVRPFDGFASQRNFGLHQLAFKHDWLLILDADERVTKHLAAEIHSVIKTAPPEAAAGRLQRRDYFMRRWLKHAQISPYFIRLVRQSRVRYEREVNEVMVVDGEIISLSEHLDHFPFSKGLTHWIAKHNVYSSMEAVQLRNRLSTPASLRSALFERDFNVRRKHQKALFYRLPCRPFLKFGYMMIVRRAFLDGVPGINYTFLQCFYEYLISLKELEYTPESR
jgi:glycosyltransferase involved in cell wall biosynthesis